MTVICWKCGRNNKVKRSGLTTCKKCGVTVAITNKDTGEVVKVR